MSAIQKLQDVTPSSLSTSILFAGRRISFEMNYTEIERHRKLLGLNWIYEPEVIAAALNYLRPGDFCVDAGSNLGYHTTLFSKLVGDDGKVVAIDADTDSIKKCWDNLELNGVKNTFVMYQALWDTKCDCSFYETLSGYSSFIKYENIESKEKLVTTATLDSILSDKFPPLRLLKIDCEGAEEPILRGAERALKRGVDCVIVELNFHILKIVGNTDRSIRDYMHGLGYKCYALSPSCKPEEIAHHWGMEPVGTHHLNVMFSRNGLPDWQAWSP